MVYDLGIDLGTTSTAAAVIRDGRVTVCRLGGTADVIPSVVSIREDGVVLTGEPAERRAVSDPSRTVREFKRRFGDTTPYIIGGTPYTPEGLTGFLLRDVVAQVTAIEGEPPRSVALAHPATWGPFKLDLLREAALLADIPDAVLVSEPVAAAIDYFPSATTQPTGTWLVFDFGGGTFDAALVALGGDAADLHASLIGTPDGLSRLGGVDFDQAVLAFVDDAIGGAVTTLDPNEPEARAGLARLRQDCREAKEALSYDNEVEIPVLLPNVRTSVRLTRSEFENAIRPRVAETNAVVDRLLTGSSLSTGELTGVLLVGGTSRIPLVVQTVRDHTGHIPAVNVDPLIAIAKGAARAAAQRSSSPLVALSAVSAASALSGSGTSVSNPGGKSQRAKVVGVALLVGVVAAAAIAYAASSDSASRKADPKTDPNGSSTSTSSKDAAATSATTSSTVRTTSTTNVPGKPTTSALTSRPTTRTTRSSSNSQTTQATSPPPTTRTTAAPTGPRFTSVSLPPTISCKNHAPSDRVDVGVAWTAAGADSVTVALESKFQTWESNLPTSGSTSYTLPCDGSRVTSTVFLTAYHAGSAPVTTTRTLTIGF